MSNVVQFRKPTLKQRHKGKTLCRSGFHRWEIKQAKQFDVKQGRLVTLYQCTRCGETKVQAE